jgi:peptide/nickel transport system permease protein
VKETRTTAAGIQLAPSKPIKSRGPWGDAFRRFMKARLSVLGLVITIFFILLGIFGPLLAPYDYMSQDLANSGQPPSREHVLGTDIAGRDQLSRILWGAQTALLAVAVSTVISMTLGIIIGGTSAYFGGYVDIFLTWIVNVVMTIPGLLLAVLVDWAVRKPASDFTETLYQMTHWKVFASSTYSNYLVVFAALAFISWPSFSQLIRGQVLSISQQDYVLSARAVGVRTTRMMTHYLVPNSLGPLLVAVTLSAGSIIVTEAGLSYLGVGIKPPGASWGGMISANLQYWSYRPYLVFEPAAILALMAVGLGFLGNGLSDALDPRRSKTS